MQKIDFKLIVDKSVDGFAIYDANGILIYKNEAIAKILNSTTESKLGTSVYEFAQSGIFSSSPAITALKEKRTVSETVQHKTGKRVFCSVVPVFQDAGNELSYLVVYLRDIGESARFEEDLEQSKIKILAYLNELSAIRLQNKIYENEGLVAESSQMRNIMQTVFRMSSSSASVLLLGETGVGKSALARFIHNQSIRASKQFISINCGALPQELLESELFGHEKGSFTGAVERKLGLFEAASGGTLFLDEVGELPLALQVKLLSVLQEKHIRRVGGIRNMPVDVRIIAATNQDIAEMIKNGRFRKDLYYRINIITIEIPQIADRKEDIVKLISWILDKHNKRYGTAKRLATETFQSMVAYEWPGNVRELDNIIERMVLLAEEDVIQPSCFLNTLNLSPGQSFSSTELPSLENALATTEKALLQEAKKRYISTRKIAQALKVSNASISRKLNKYGI